MKKLLPALFFLIVLSFLIYLFLSGDKKKGMHKAAPDFTLSAAELFADFFQDESAANEKYLNKVLIISGEIRGIAKDKNGMPSLNLKTNHIVQGVQCSLDAQSQHKRQEFHLGENVSLKCICMDFFTDVKLTNCVEN